MPDLKIHLIPIDVTINGKRYQVDVEPRLLLVEFIRERIGLTGTHVGCDTSYCGACTVLLNGETIKSCTTLAVQADGATVLTVEGLETADGLHPLQQSFREHHALQCGYCTPGMLLSSYALLEENPDPSRDDIRKRLSGNICRCTGYQNIYTAVEEASKLYKEA